MPDRNRLPRWGIVATVDEPASLLAAWVAHHLSVGASELHLFLDRPNPQAEALLGGIEGVILHHSGEDGWKGRAGGKRPAHHVHRQSHNATRILRTTALDWLVHCDADEFLYMHSPLAEELAATKARVDWLRLHVSERVWPEAGEGADIFAGLFRRPLRNFAEAGPKVYDAARMSRMNSGLTGHELGKSCVRVGTDKVMNIHRPSGRDGERELLRAHSRAVGLLHFNGMTRLHYIMKMVRRALISADSVKMPSTPGRKLQFQSAADHARDPAALTRMWREMQSITAHEADLLAEFGVLHAFPADIAGTAKAMFGDSIDLSPEGFNRALIAHDAASLAEMRDRTGFDPAPLMAAS